MQVVGAPLVPPKGGGAVLVRALPLGGGGRGSYFAGGVATLVATFLPLAFLGAAFAWTYEKTGKLHAAMTVHLLFNLLNMALCLCFPELGQP